MITIYGNSLIVKEDSQQIGLSRASSSRLPLILFESARVRIILVELATDRPQSHLAVCDARTKDNPTIIEHQKGETCRRIDKAF